MLRRALILLVLATACGEQSGLSNGGGTDTPDASSTPVVTNVSPRTWAAGSRVTFAGQRFTKSTRFELDGTFDGDNASFTVTPSSVSATKASFVFEGDELPLRTGRFSGHVTAVTGSVRSDAQSVTIEVGPSIVLTRFAPSGCGEDRVTATLPGSRLAIDATVTGLDGAVVTGSFVDLNGAPQSFTVPATVDLGTPEALLPTEPGTDVGISLTATGSDGTTLQRTAIVSIHPELDLIYDGNTEIAELYTPQAVTGCLAGGPNGSNFNYSENSSEKRARSYSVNASVKLDVFFISGKFGINVTQDLESKTGTSLQLSHSVFRNYYGAFFRQTARIERVGKVVRYDECGNDVNVGEVTVTDWTWAPGFNQKAGPCPPLPEPLMSEVGAVE